MPPSEACLNARTSLEEIRTLKRDFDVAYDLAVSSGKQDDITKAQDLKVSLESQMTALQETLAIHEAERLYDLKRQYEAQTSLLKKAGLIEMRKEADASGVEREVSFMTGIDGKAYPMPSYETIVYRLAERKELFETKADQGFTKLLLVPFGMSLDALIAKFKAHMLAYKKTHPAFGRTDPTKTDDSDKPERNPLWVWEERYNGADANGTLVYDPVLFDKDNHHGKTKAEILVNQEVDNDDSTGWRVLLLQGGKDNKGVKGIPRSGNGQAEGTKVPRQDIEAGKSPNDYLTRELATTSIEDSPYHGESGMTPEEWIVTFMTDLEETDKPMDNWQNATDSIAYLTGAYFLPTDSASDYVPVADWNRVGRQADLGGYDPGDVGEYIGVRSAVRV